MIYQGFQNNWVNSIFFLRCEFKQKFEMSQNLELTRFLFIFCIFCKHCDRAVHSSILGLASLRRDIKTGLFYHHSDSERGCY
jgi:hypothetical protein